MNITITKQAAEDALSSLRGDLGILDDEMKKHYKKNGDKEDGVIKAFKDLIVRKRASHAEIDAALERLK